MQLGTWHPVGRAVWEGLGGVALLEEVYQGQALRFSKSHFQLALFAS